jgi:hypothetical protein
MDQNCENGRNADSFTIDGFSTGPALRAFEQIPSDCLAYVVQDHSCEPLIRRGEVAIIDVSNHEPEDGALFLSQAGSVRNGNFKLYVVETILKHARVQGDDGQFIQRPVWYLGNHLRPHGAAQIEAWLRAGKPGAFVDGPYAHDGDKAWYVRSLLIGRVVGILGASTGPQASAGTLHTLFILIEHADKVARSVRGQMRGPAPGLRRS